jgi:ankyrin
VAAHFGSASMVRWLLAQSAGGREDDGRVRIDVQNRLGYTPLHQAAQQGHSQIVNILLEHNASPNTVSNVSGLYLSVLVALQLWRRSAMIFIKCRLL